MAERWVVGAEWERKICWFERNVGEEIVARVLKCGSQFGVAMHKWL